MAGGMILMGIFSFFLSVPAAMALHGWHKPYPMVPESGDIANISAGTY